MGKFNLDYQTWWATTYINDTHFSARFKVHIVKHIVNYKNEMKWDKESMDYLKGEEKVEFLLYPKTQSNSWASFFKFKYSTVHFLFLFLMFLNQMKKNWLGEIYVYVKIWKLKINQFVFNWSKIVYNISFLFFW